MPEYSYFLRLSLYLAFLSYYIGVLILASPIPLYHFKKWGPILIKDAILVFILLISIDNILSFIGKISSIIGASWNGYNAWIRNTLTFLEEQRFIILSFYLALKTFNASIIYADLLGPLLRTISYNIFALYTYSFIGSFFHNYLLLLMSMGLLFIAIPFRIGRSAGAWLLALAIVFYIGLPLLPAFTQYVTPPLEPVSSNSNALAVLGVSYPLTRLSLSQYSTYPPHLIMEFKTYYNDKEVVIARYLSDGLIIDTDNPEKGLPSKKEFKAYLIADGLAFPLEPYPVNPRKDYVVTNARLTLCLKSPLIVWMRSDYTILYKSKDTLNVSIESLTKHNGTYNISLLINGDGYLELRLPKDVNVEIGCDNCTVDKGSWNWLGLSGYYYKLKPGPSPTRALLAIGKKSGLNPDLDGIQYYYVKDFLGITTDSLYYIFSNVFYRTVLIPVLYIALLTLISRQLARLLGSRIFPTIPLR